MPKFPYIIPKHSYLKSIYLILRILKTLYKPDLGYVATNTSEDLSGMLYMLAASSRYLCGMKYRFGPTWTKPVRSPVGIKNL